ncbi:MAG TPA: hypothetical protein VEY07_08890 [Thermoplasmata archaeon]|nr:hypothetical protein [Thermoplasmata archaeon]
MAPSSKAPTDSSLPWMDVGGAPPAVLEARRARVSKVTPWFSLGSAALLGGVAGLVATILWPGSGGWSLSSRIELFAVVAILVGAGEYVFFQKMIPWLANASVLNVRRVAIAGDDLRIELDTGRMFSFPLARLSVSREPTADGWYAIALPSGRVTPLFYAPGTVTATIRASIPPR